MVVNQLDDNREFKDSALGMIPKDWDVWNIEEIIYTIIDFRGRTPLKIGMTWGGGDIPALSANNVEMGKINLAKETNYGSEDLYKKWMNKGDAKKGDIIITMEAPLGNIAQIPDHRKYILSQRVILLKTKENLIYNDFLKNFLLSDLFQNRLKSYSSGTTATGIQQSKLLQLPIIVPPIPQQQQIAKILDTVDKAIAQTESLIAKYKRIKTGLMIDKTEETFGDYIDKYTMRESIADGTTLEIVYEGRTHNAEIIDKTTMDAKFSDVFSEYNLSERLQILGYGTRDAYL
ncbi:hypothetical protein A6770_22385 [Nostoc minutum NIES-26]|uniref:Uncharacterized protein n=1 Tax=Nostoc minutum NIES-26 TaxID=1844469 RepID=A0A367QYB5_9NOSO|nr:hypothetical protein A6770_22385 [Nostoc minutum NIES-26]